MSGRPRDFTLSWLLHYTLAEVSRVVLERKSERPWLCLAFCPNPFSPLSVSVTVCLSPSLFLSVSLSLSLSVSLCVCVSVSLSSRDDPRLCVKIQELTSYSYLWLYPPPPPLPRPAHFGAKGLTCFHPRLFITALSSLSEWSWNSRMNVLDCILALPPSPPPPRKPSGQK